MKHLLIIIITIFCLNSYDANSCPLGYTGKSDTLQINGCHFVIDYCYRCTPVGAYDGWMEISGVRKLSSSCVMSPSKSFEEVLEILVENFLTNLVFEVCDMEPCDEPPTIESTSIFNVLVPICWYKTLNGFQINYYPCMTNNICSTDYYVCFDGFTYYEVHKEWELAGEADPNEDCPDSEPADPTLIDPISDCFQIETDCSPY